VSRFSGGVGCVPSRRSGYSGQEPQTLAARSFLFCSI
jgi:hypothetical protein